MITLPVSDVERALRFYVDHVGFTLDLDYSPNDGFRVVRLDPARAQTMPASLTSQIPMATAGCHRNGSIANEICSRGLYARVSGMSLWRCRGLKPATTCKSLMKGVPMGSVTFQKVNVDGIGIFYREAGPKEAPTILLLHGFPTAGHMFRDLIPQLADQFRLIAPDLPGFGQSDMPARSAFTYTFENIANLIDRFTEVIGLQQFAMYVFDYGAPVRFRIAVRHPDRLTAIISQNGNAYEEGLSDGWNPKSRRCPTERPSADSSLPRRRTGSTRTVCLT